MNLVNIVIAAAAVITGIYIYDKYLYVANSNAGSVVNTNG